jgi:hypothetical protein
MKLVPISSIAPGSGIVVPDPGARKAAPCTSADLVGSIELIFPYSAAQPVFEPAGLSNASKTPRRSRSGNPSRYTKSAFFAGVCRLWLGDVHDQEIRQHVTIERSIR